MNEEEKNRDDLISDMIKKWEMNGNQIQVEKPGKMGFAKTKTVREKRILCAALPAMTKEQKKFYQKLKNNGFDRETALAEVFKIIP